MLLPPVWQPWKTKLSPLKRLLTKLLLQHCEHLINMVQLGQYYLQPFNQMTRPLPENQLKMRLILIRLLTTLNRTFLHRTWLQNSNLLRHFGSQRRTLSNIIPRSRKVSLSHPILSKHFPMILTKMWKTRIARMHIAIWDNLLVPMINHLSRKRRRNRRNTDSRPMDMKLLRKLLILSEMIRSVTKI